MPESESCLSHAGSIGKPNDFSDISQWVMTQTRIHFRKHTMLIRLFSTRLKAVFTLYRFSSIGQTMLQSPV